MKYLAIASLAASLVSAAPFRPVKNDTDVLQYALSLEHLEYAYYKEGLGRFDDKAFEDAHLPAFVRGRVKQINEHEAAHVKLLEKALTAAGQIPTKPCTYEFGLTDPWDFVKKAAILELTGTAAYLGAAPLITDKNILATAGSILSTEARHDSWYEGAVDKQSPWNGAFEQGLGPLQVITIAGVFIKECPAGNFDLGKPFPDLKLTPSQPTPGAIITVEADGVNLSADLFLAIRTSFGDGPLFVPVADGMAKIPQKANFQGNIFVTLTNKVSAGDDDTVAGPKLLDYYFDSQASNAGPSS